MLCLFVVVDSNLVILKQFVAGEEMFRLAGKGFKILLKVSLNALVFKAQIKGFKVIASKYKILRLGKRIYLILI